MENHQSKTQSSSYLGILMWLCAATFYSFQFLLRVSPNVMTHQLMATFDIQACALGAMVSFYYWGYSLMQVPAGLLLDNIGPRRPLTAACLLCFAGCLIFGLSPNIYMLGLGRVLMGIGSSFGFLTSVRIISTWFKLEKLGFFVGLTLLLGTFGAICASSPLGKLLTLTTWRTCMLILAGISGILSMASWKLVRDGGPTETLVKKPDFSLTHILLSLVEIAKNPQTWIYALYGFMMYVPLSGFADLWATPFISEQFSLDHSTASAGVFAFYVGMGLGSPLWPLIADRLQSYKKAMFLSALLMAFFLTLCLYYTSFTFVWNCFFLWVAGLCSAGQFLAFSSIAYINARDRAATASGVHNMLCMFSGNFMQPFLGYLLRHSWESRGGVFVEGAPHYTLDDFHFALTSLPIALGIAGIAILFVKETYPKKT